MAQHEQDREDLLREATALVERAEITIAKREDPVVVGFRRDGSFSIFFGADPVYQFNSAKQLRRAYVAGLLYRAEQGKLVSLRRERGPETTTLLRHNVNAAEQDRLLKELSIVCQEFYTALNAGDYTLTGEVPAGGSVVQRVLEWFATLPAPVVVAQRPNVS